jgi:hypothetical protein
MTWGARGLVSAWVAGRLITLAMFWSSENAVAFDVRYYWAQLDAGVHGGSAAQTLREYPLPAIVTMLTQFAVTYAHRSAFVVVFVATMLMVDAVFTRVLWRSDEPGAHRAAWFWTVFVPFLGPVALFRFDMVPAVLSAVALMVLTSRPRTAGALAGAATAIKAWPVLVLASIARPPRSRRAVLSAYGLVVAAAAVITAAWAGLGRLISPWTWQTTRGLQIESLTASPEMLVRRIVGVRRWPITLQYHAWQLDGPGTRAALVASTVLQLVAVLCIAVTYLRLYRCAVPTPAALRWTAIASVLLFVVANKTLSPQYLVWVAALVATLLLGETDRSTTRFAITLLFVAAASHAVFPWLYGRILVGTDPAGIGVAILLARNLVLLALTWYATRVALNATGAVPRGRSRPDPIAAR